MKAKYEKPVLEVVQLELNLEIASCSEDPYYDMNEVQNCKKQNNGDGYFTSENNCDVEYEDKCYFTATYSFSS